MYSYKNPNVCMFLHAIFADASGKIKNKNRKNLHLIEYLNILNVHCVYIYIFNQL